MRIGDRVIIHERRDTFHGRSGSVTAITPKVMVHIDGERLPVCINRSSLIPEEESGPLPLTGAE